MSKDFKRFIIYEIVSKNIDIKISFNNLFRGV